MLRALGVLSALWVRFLHGCHLKADTFLMVTVALRSVIIALRNVRCAPAFALCSSTPTRLVAMERASTILTASNAVNALWLAQCGLAR